MLDIAHLKVSCNTLKKDFKKESDYLLDQTDYIHLSGNDGMEDSNKSLINDYDRLPLEALYEEILGLKIKKVVIPVSAGRNIAVLVEAAVRNTVLQLRGIDTMQEFMEKQRKAIKKSEA